MRAKSHAVRSNIQPNADEQELIRRRVRPFVDADRPMILLLSEAYVQGLRDAVQCHEMERTTQPGLPGEVNQSPAKDEQGQDQ